MTLVPLIWLVSVTFTAGVQKIFHDDPRIGFLAQARVLEAKAVTLRTACEAARAGGEAQAIAAAEQALRGNRTLHFNNVLDAYVAGIFLLLVTLILLLSLREWILLLARKKLAQLCETEPVWLPDYAVAEGKPFKLFSLLALAIGLARELSDEAALDRAQREAAVCSCDGAPRDGEAQACGHAAAGARKKQLYAQVLERRFQGVRRCC